MVVDQGRDRVRPEARVRDRGERSSSRNHDRFHSGPATDLGQSPTSSACWPRRPKRRLIIKQARELGFKGRFNPHRTGRHLGRGEHRRKRTSRACGCTGSSRPRYPRRFKSWQARYTKKYGEWNATSIDFANPAFAFVAAVKKRRASIQRSRPMPSASSSRESSGAKPTSEGRTTTHRQPDHLPDAISEVKDGGRDPRDSTPPTS